MLLFALVASFLWIVTSLYSIGYMRGHHEENQTRFYFFFAIAIAGAIGVAFSANLFTLFAFYEVLTLCTFPLVTHHGTEAARAAVREHVEHLDEDRPLYPDHNAMRAAVRDLAVLEAVESEIGELAAY